MGLSYQDLGDGQTPKEIIIIESVSELVTLVVLNWVSQKKYTKLINCYSKL